MRRRLFVALRQEQRGAVAAIVAISLICMLGMLVLTFDLGHGIAVKRNMVNAADSAVLAAAQACAVGQPIGQAQQAARDLIAANNSGAQLTDFSADPAMCSGDPNQLRNQATLVTVSSSVSIDYYFAPIFGINSGQVVSHAQALWGPAIGVANPVPLRLDGSNTDKCLSHPATDPPYEGSDCAFAFDHSNSGPASDWGFLNFPDGWPTAPPNPGDCSSQAGGANNLIDYLSGSVGDFEPVLWTNPVWVCADGGMNATTLNWFINWLLQQVGQSLIFPVEGPQGILDVPGGQAWPIVGFVKLTVVGAWKGQQALQHCTFTGNYASVFCIQLARDPVEVTEGIPGSGLSYSQLMAVRLVG